MRLLPGLLGLTLTSVVALASANAADVYVPSAPGGYKDAYVPVATWAGFYLGGHVGGAWGSLKTTDFDEVPGKWKNETSDIFGGGQIGYNFQRGNFVFGIEVDLGDMNLNKTVAQPGTGGVIQSSIRGGFYGDVTGRLGYAFDRSLLYAKGGFAFFDGDVKSIDVGEASVKMGTMSGWTIGGGIEHKFTPNWSVKAEYQYFDFGSETKSLPSDGDRYKNELTAHTFKVGLNYFLAPAYEPLK